MIALALACLFFVIVGISTIVNGWVLSLLWAWFLVPMGLPAISIPLAMGVALVVAFMTSHYRRDKDIEDDEWPERLAHVIAWVVLRPSIALVFGWCIKSFL